MEYISETKSKVGLTQSMEFGAEMQSKRGDEVVGGVGEYKEYLLDGVCLELCTGHIPSETLVLGGVP